MNEAHYRFYYNYIAVLYTWNIFVQRQLKQKKYHYEQQE